MPTDKTICTKCMRQWRDHSVNEDLTIQCPGYVEGPTSGPRPANMAELARLVAIELRKHRVAWWQGGAEVWVVRLRGPLPDPPIMRFCYSLLGSAFDNLTPREIADAIQAEEAKRAQEWASDV